MEETARLLLLRGNHRHSTHGQWQGVKVGKDTSDSSELQEKESKHVVITVSSLLCAARMEQYEKFLIPGIRNGCGTTVYNI